METVKRFIEAITCARRRRAVRRAVSSLRRDLGELLGPGSDVDAIGIRINRDLADIEFHGPLMGGEIPGVRIWR